MFPPGSGLTETDPITLTGSMSPDFVPEGVTDHAQADKGKDHGKKSVNAPKVPGRSAARRNQQATDAFGDLLCVHCFPQGI